MLNYFDKCVVLNVDIRNSEQLYLLNKIKSLGIEPTFYQVGEGKLFAKESYDRVNKAPDKLWASGPFARLHNSYNAFLSYQDIVRKAKEEKVQKLLIFEDDVEFTQNFKTVFKRGIQQINQNSIDWKLFYLGANHTWARTKHLDANILKVNGSVCWHAIGIHHSIFDEIISWRAYSPIDDKAKELHEKFTCVALWPNVAIQKPGFSNVEGKFRDYSEFWGNKGGSV